MLVHHEFNPANVQFTLVFDQQCTKHRDSHFQGHRYKLKTSYLLNCLGVLMLGVACVVQQNNWSS